MSDQRDDAAAAARGPAPPDAGAVNAAWRAEPTPRAGARGLLDRVLVRLLGPRLEAQRDWNARQVQLDNALLQYVEERFALTHRHYDELLGLLGRRIDEGDERHRQLERELVRHVHDLVERIDLVLVESQRGRHETAAALEDTRERLLQLEQMLRGRSG